MANRGKIAKLFALSTAIIFTGFTTFALSKESKVVNPLFTYAPHITATAEDYWDNFDFKNQELLKNSSLMKAAISEYIQAIETAPKEVAESSLNKFLDSSLNSSFDIYTTICSYLEEALYDHSSPQRNEELYIHVLRHTIGSTTIEDIYKIRPRAQLEMVSKNRIGERATDFNFTSKEGQQSTLYAIDTQYTIIFFNTPDCDDCKQVKKQIKGSNKLTKMVEDKTVTILGIYTQNDVKEWRKAKYPPSITNGIDTEREITRKNLYDLKAMPTLYLLDKDKKIILKDRSIEEIEKYL